MSDEPNNSTAYLFEPKSPLVFRTGRPFDQAGDPVSLDFPLPSTLAGACRTAVGDAKKIDFDTYLTFFSLIYVHHVYNSPRCETIKFC